jgi:hypothetical protein
VLVCATGTTDRSQLSDQKHRGIAGFHDAFVDCQRCTVRCICYCAELQYTADGAAAVFLLPVWRKLGTVSGLWSVRYISSVSSEDFRRTDSDLFVANVEFRKWRTWTATLLLICLFIVFAGVELGLVYAIRPPYNRGIDWPVLLVGVVSFILLIGAYFAIPFELLKRRGRVVGIDFIFLTVDWCGAFFSLMSLVAQSEFDALFGTMYALCCAIEMSMVVSHLIWRLRTRGIRKRAKAEGKTFDESAEGRAWQAEGIDLEAKFWKIWKLIRREDKVKEEEEHVEGTISAEVAGKNTVPIGVV